MQCKAKSKRSGKQCTRHAIAGGVVCPMHGGAAPQVKLSAALRLQALVDPALLVIAENLKDRQINPAVAQRAAEDVLDRAVGKTPETIRLVGTGEDGAIQIEDVTAAQLIRRELARVRERGSSGSNSKPAE